MVGNNFSLYYFFIYCILYQKLAGRRIVYDKFVLWAKFQFLSQLLIKLWIGGNGI